MWFNPVINYRVIQFSNPKHSIKESKTNTDNIRWPFMRIPPIFFGSDVENIKSQNSFERWRNSKLILFAVSFSSCAICVGSVTGKGKVKHLRVGK